MLGAHRHKDHLGVVHTRSKFVEVTSLVGSEVLGSGLFFIPFLLVAPVNIPQAQSSHGNAQAEQCVSS